MSQQARLASKHFCLVIIVLGAVAGPLCYAQEEAPLTLDDPNAVIVKVLAALKHVDRPATGRGKASMTIKNLKTENKEKHFAVDFVFKGPNSRADILARDEAGALARWYCEVNSEKAIIQIRARDARIERPEVHEPELGYDFSPKMFLRCFGAPVTEHLELALKHPDVPRSIELDRQGILHLTTSSRKRMASGQPHSKTKLSFDPRKGFRPVYYEWRITEADGSWSADTTTLEWAQYDGVWYVSRGELKTLPNSSTVHRIFTIKSFKPNVEISDKEFTLDGLGLPDGFPVSDSIEGTTYRYGDKTHAERIVHRASP